MKKKIFAFLTFLFLPLSLVGCNKNDNKIDYYVSQVNRKEALFIPKMVECKCNTSFTKNTNEGKNTDGSQ